MSYQLPSNSIVQLSDVENIAYQIQLWSSEMGFELKNADMFKGMPNAHVAAWLHIIKHVRPKNEVKMIKQNILLNNLKSKNTAINGNDHPDFKSERVKEYKKLQKRLIDKKAYEKTAKENLKKMVDELHTTEVFNDSLNSEILEYKRKAHILKVKKRKIKKQIEKHDKICKTINMIKSRPVNTEEEKAEDTTNNGNLENCLSEIEIHFHNHDLGEGKADLSADINALANKMCENCLTIPAITVYNQMINTIRSLNSNMSKVLETSLQIRKTSSVDPSQMDALNFKHINLFIECSRLKGEITKITDNINNVKDEVSAKICDRFPDLFLRNENNSFTDSCFAKAEILNYLADRSNEYSMEEYNRCLASKFEEIKDETSSIDSQSDIISALTNDLESLNAERKTRLTSTLESLNCVLNGELMKLLRLWDNTRTEVIQSFNLFKKGEDDVSIVQTLKDSIKNELELFVKLPSRMFAQNVSLSHLNRVVQSPFSIQVSLNDTLLMLNIFTNLLWHNELCKSNTEFPDAITPRSDMLNKLITSKKLCEPAFCKEIARIGNKLTSAQQVYDEIQSFIFLFDGVYKMLFKDKFTEQITQNMVIDELKKRM